MADIEFLPVDCTIYDMANKIRELTYAYNVKVVTLNNTLDAIKALVTEDSVNDMEKLTNKIWAFTSRTEFKSNVFVTLNDKAMITEESELTVWKVVESSSPDISSAKEYLILNNTNYVAILTHIYESRKIEDELNSLFSDTDLGVYNE